jgi:hypothetical protein
VGGGDIALETFHFTLNYQTLSVERLPQPPPSTTVAGGGISRHRGFKVVGPRIQITLKGQKYYKIVFSSTYFPICWKECQIIVQCRECTNGFAVMKVFAAFFLTFQQFTSKKRRFPRNGNAQWIARVWRGGVLGWMRPFKGQVSKLS